jgi:hypothetical protein
MPPAAKAVDLSWWPRHGAAAQEVQVQVGDRLPGLFFAVDHQAIAVANPQLLGQAGGYDVQVAKDIAVLLPDVRMRSDYFPGDNENMDRGLRIDVVEGQATIILVDKSRRDLPVNDLLE